MSIDYSKHFPLSVPGMRNPKNLEELVESIFSVLRQIGFFVFIAMEDENHAEVTITNIGGVTVTFVAVSRPKDFYKNLKISDEVLDNLTELLAWISQTANDTLEWPDFDASYASNHIEVMPSTDARRIQF